MKRLAVLVREGCPSELHLDRLVVGELTAGEDRSVRAHIAGCSECCGRLADIETARAAFVELDAGRRFVARGRTRWRWISAATAMTAAITIVLIVALPRQYGVGNQGPGARAKGIGEHMAVYIARGSQAGATRRAAPGDEVAVGDTLQMTITLRERRFVALLGIDATRVARVYFPDGDRLAPIEPGIDVPLPASIRLDAMPGREDFVTVFCDEPIAIAAVRTVLSTDLAAVPAGCTSDQLHVIKPGGAGPR